jgi:hypothetical protein
VLAIISHVLLDLKTFGVQRVILRSDNAGKIVPKKLMSTTTTFLGCYHSSLMLASIPKISEDTGVAVIRYTFSEPQVNFMLGPEVRPGAPGRDF